MPLEPRSELEKLLEEYARADEAVNRGQGVRHNVMHAITEWVERYAKQKSKA